MKLIGRRGSARGCSRGRASTRPTLRGELLMAQPPALSLRGDEPDRPKDDAEDQQSHEVGVLARHHGLRRSIVAPTAKKNKAVPRTALVHCHDGPLPSSHLSSIPKAAIRTPTSRIASPVISATPRRSAIAGFRS